MIKYIYFNLMDAFMLNYVFAIISLFIYQTTEIFFQCLYSFATISTITIITLNHSFIQFILS